MRIVRRRIPYGAFLIATVALGLASRRYPAAFAVIIARYGGDALWAGAVYWLTALIRPALNTVRVALIALTISVLVESSQLYHAHWIDGMRATRLGSLLLGQGFLWSDLVSYTAGITLMALLDGWFRQRYPIR